MDPDRHSPEEAPERGPAAVAAALTRSGAFVDCVFHCAECGLGGTSLIRPARIVEKSCLGCGSPVVVTVLDRFPRR